MKKYVQVGCGYRGVYTYSKPLVKEFGDVAQLCGVYDTNYKRAELVSQIVEAEIPVYDDFDKMLEDVKPDVVLVTPKDSVHDEYIIKALYAGCDVITEKPLTTTFPKALAIQKAQRETGKNVTVTFNLRFHPFFKRVKEIVATGMLGKIYSVNYEWLLDTSHGADYFRRWHRKIENSGSLLIHKSTHHFDIANWLLEQDPVAVNAFGALNYYGTNGQPSSERCLTCHHKDTCKFYLDITKSSVWRAMYLGCEDVDGYYRDGCVFSPEINIQDTVNVSVLYSGGTVMNYALTAHSPYEGMRITLNGENGRLEIQNIMGENKSAHTKADDYIRFYNRDGGVDEYVIETEDFAREHGGADPRLRNSLFRGHEPESLGQMADLRAGMMSIGIGMAANLSMKENRRVKLSEFFEELKAYEK